MDNEFRGQLGGKDPAYIRSDADLEYTVNELVDGKDIRRFEFVIDSIISAWLQVLFSTQARAAAQ